MAASLPPKYTGAVILGCNLCGVLTTLVSIASNSFTDNKRAAAIYYFITALFILLICFDTYFALPLNVSLFTIYFRAKNTLSMPAFSIGFRYWEPGFGSRLASTCENFELWKLEYLWSSTAYLPGFSPSTLLLSLFIRTFYQKIISLFWFFFRDFIDTISCWTKKRLKRRNLQTIKKRPHHIGKYLSKLFHNFLMYFSHTLLL